MKSLWDDAQAAKQADEGELALRVYTSRLLGSDHSLIMCGGGNTSISGRNRTFSARARRLCTSRAAAGIWRRLSRPASPRRAWAACCACRGWMLCQTRRWSRNCAAAWSIRTRRRHPSRRSCTLSCLTSGSITRTRTPCGHHQHARWREAHSGSVWRALRVHSVCHARLQAGALRSRRIPRPVDAEDAGHGPLSARHLHLWRDGQNRLRAHDRVRSMAGTIWRATTPGRSACPRWRPPPAHSGWNWPGSAKKRVTWQASR